MSLNAAKVEGKGGARLDPIPEGNEAARLVQVIDLGVQPQRAWEGKEKEPIQMIQTVYELCNVFMLDEDGNEDKERPRWLFEDFAFHNLNADRAKSTKRYTALDAAGVHEGDWTALVGSPCTVTVVQNVSKKDASIVYNNVGNVTPPMRGMDIPELVGEPLFFSFDEPNKEVFDKLPEFLQNKIKEALNYPGSAVQVMLEPVPHQEEEEGENNPY